MVLRDYYFDNLMTNGSAAPGTHSLFRRAAESSFGTYHV